MRFKTLLLLLCLLLPQFALADGPPKKPNYPEGVSSISPGSELWGAVRQRDGVLLDGVSQVRGVDAGILINEQGYRWARF